MKFSADNALDKRFFLFGIGLIEIRTNFPVTEKACGAQRSSHPAAVLPWLIARRCREPGVGDCDGPWGVR